jgi:hypothetical protein
VVTYLWDSECCYERFTAWPSGHSRKLAPRAQISTVGFFIRLQCPSLDLAGGQQFTTLMAMCSFPSYVGTFPHAERLGLGRKSLRKIKKTNKVTASL